jgi:hypothetical protein
MLTSGINRKSLTLPHFNASFVSTIDSSWCTLLLYYLLLAVSSELELLFYNTTTTSTTSSRVIERFHRGVCFKR